MIKHTEAIEGGLTSWVFNYQCMKAIKKIINKLHNIGGGLKKRVVNGCHKMIGWPRPPFFCPACANYIWNCEAFSRDIGNGASKLEPGGRLCPICGSFERTRHFALYIDQNDLLRDVPRTLHFAPEKPIESKLRKKLKSRYTTTDLFMSGVDCNEDITAMNFSDASFDLIYCSNVLEHIEDDAAAMRELFRILSPGGMAIVQVPIKGLVTYENPEIKDPRDRYEHFGQADHVRYYGEDIKMRLENAGFKVTPFYMIDILKLKNHDLFKMNLNKRELIHKCEKPQATFQNGYQHTKQI